MEVLDYVPCLGRGAAKYRRFARWSLVVSCAWVQRDDDPVSRYTFAFARVYMVTTEASWILRRTVERLP